MRDIAAEAEGVIQNLQKDRSGNLVLKTNQIRKFLTAVNTISNKINIERMTHPEEKTIPDNLAGEIKYLKVKLAYQAGRDNKYGPVRDFVDKTELLKRVDVVGDSFAKYDEFAKFVEALVAYHKFYGGRDK